MARITRICRNSDVRCLSVYLDVCALICVETTLIIIVAVAVGGLLLVVCVIAVVVCMFRKNCTQR